MRNLSKKAFSFVELLVVITILSIIGAIWVSLNDGYKEKTYNTKVVTDLATIENALIRFKQEKSFLPSPEGNLKYFTKDGYYAHDENEAFGFHGFITETTIPKSFINVLPRDPRSNNYYAYGKTLYSGLFEVAGVNAFGDKFESVVKGSFIGKEPLYNLIREYNGPDFVYDKSKKNFPYNPEEMIMDAKIVAFTGELILNNSITDKNKILERSLVPGDNIKLSTGSTATIYYSDGSYSELGSNDSALELTLSVMKYKKDNNLFTRVRLALNFGAIITKASKMSGESNFDLYTIDTEASVRGTIFEMKRLQGDNKTYVKVLKGSIFLNGINIPNYDILLEKLKNDEEIIPKFPIEGLPSEVVEIKYNDKGVKESILKEPNDISMPATIIPIAGCDPVTQHNTILGCEDNTRSCSINYGEGKQDWDFGKNDWTDCKLVSCIVGYKPSGNNCILDNTCSLGYLFYIDKCILKSKLSFCSGLPSNASRNIVNKINQDFDIISGKYLPDSLGKYNLIDSDKECRFKCNSTFVWDNTISKCICLLGNHEEDFQCKSNTQTCGTIENGTKIMTWNTTTNSRGSCNVSCNSGYSYVGGMCKLSCPSGKHEESGVCKSNTQTCGTIENGTKIMTWNTTTNSRGSCNVSCNSGYSYVGGMCKLSCPSGKHEESGSCVSNKQSCNIVNGKGEKIWSDGSRSSCKVTECKSGYKISGNSCILNCPSGFSDAGGGYCYGSGKGCSGVCVKWGADRKSGLSCYGSCGNRYEYYCSNVTETKGGKGVACQRQKAASSLTSCWFKNCPWSNSEDLNWTGYYKP